MVCETSLMSSVAAVRPFHLCATSHCMHSPPFIYPFNYWWPWGSLLFLLLVIIRNTSVNIVFMFLLDVSTHFCGRHSFVKGLCLCGGGWRRRVEGQFRRQGPLGTAFHQRALRKQAPSEHSPRHTHQNGEEKQQISFWLLSVVFVRYYFPNWGKIGM